MEKNELLMETIHTLFCDLDHSGNMHNLMKGREGDKCYFYLEKSFVERWELPDHVYWNDCATNIKNDLKASNSESALRSIYRILDVIEKAQQLSSEEFRLFIRLLNSNG